MSQRIRNHARVRADHGPSSRVRGAAMRFVVAVVAALAVFAVTREARAYSWMIRHDYTGCSQCHADPSGGGLLTEYGRAQSELLLRTQYTKGSEEEVPKTAGFLGFIQLPSEHLLLGGDARLMYLAMKTSIPQAQDVTLNRTILMQADLSGEVRAGRFRADGSIGYVHDGDAALAASITRGNSTPGPDFMKDRLISRVHWLGVDIGEDNQVTLRAGRMNIPFGVRQIEHTMWVRATTRTDINAAQEDGVALAYNGERIRGEIMGIAGNFQVRPDDFRDRGYAAYLEYAPMPKLALGASSMIVHADADITNPGLPVWRHAHGIFGRYTPHRIVVLTLETDMLVFSQPKPADPTVKGGIAGMLQADVEPIQGVHAIVTGEMKDQQLSRDQPSFGLWGGVQWFFAPHADVRFDAITQTSPGGINTVTFLLQGHVFL